MRPLPIKYLIQLNKFNWIKYLIELNISLAKAPFPIKYLIQINI